MGRRRPPRIRARTLPGVPMRIAIDFTLAPLKRLINQLDETDTIDVIDTDGKEVPVFVLDKDIVAVSIGVRELAEFYETAMGAAAPTQALRRLVATIDKNEPFDVELLDELKAALPALRDAGRRIPPELAYSIVALRKAEMEQDMASA